MSHTCSLSEIQDLIYRGWLPVHVKGLGRRHLCYGIKVEIIKRYKRQEEIKILEGPFRDLIARAPLKNRFSLESPSFFKKRFLPEKPAVLFLKTQAKSLEIKGLGIFSVEFDDKNIFPGIYFLEIPSHPHKKIPRYYLNENIGGSRFAETWFRIVSPRGSFSESFLHYGQQSKGCLAVSQENSWNNIYNHLIIARKGRLNIGTLTIS